MVTAKEMPSVFDLENHRLIFNKVLRDNIVTGLSNILDFLEFLMIGQQR